MTSEEYRNLNMGKKANMPAKDFRKAVKEKSVHAQVVAWLKAQYPHIIFRTDGGGIRLTIGQATQFARMQAGRAWPDVFIPEPRGKYAGLFIEVKRDHAEAFCKDGSIRANAHIMEQNNVLIVLRAKGFKAEFGCGFEGCKNIITDYLTITQ